MSDDDHDRAEIQCAYARSQIRNDDIDTSIEFHRQLAAAILDVGVRHASPLKLVEQMTDQASCHHLTMEQVKSHLQRYRKVYKEHGRQKFLKEFDKFTKIIDRVYDHAQHPGSFAMVDLNYVVGGRAAAMVSHQVRAEYSDLDTAQRFNVLDECSFVHTTTGQRTRDGSAKKYEQEGRSFYDRHHQIKYDDERIKTQTEANQTVQNSQNPKQSKQDREFMLIRAPILTEKEKATPLGAAIQQIVGVIQNYAEYIQNDEGRRTPTLPVISHIQQDTNEQKQLPPNSQILTHLSQIQPQNRLDHRIYQPRQRDDEDEDHGHRQKQQRQQQYQSIPGNPDDSGRLALNPHHVFESVMEMDDVCSNDTFRLTMTQEGENQEEIGDPIGLGRFYPIGDGGIVSDGGNAVGSVSSSKDCDIEDILDSDPLQL